MSSDDRTETGDESVRITTPRHLRTDQTPVEHRAAYLCEVGGGVYPTPRGGVHRDNRDWAVAS